MHPRDNKDDAHCEDKVLKKLYEMTERVRMLYQPIFLNKCSIYLVIVFFLNM